MSNVLAIDVGCGRVKWVSTNAEYEIKKGMRPSAAAITARDRTLDVVGMSNLR